MTGDKEEVKIVEKIVIHPDADSHGISDPVRNIITDLLDKNISTLTPTQFHVWLNHKDQADLMNDKIMPNHLIITVISLMM